MIGKVVYEEKVALHMAWIKFLASCGWSFISQWEINVNINETSVITKCFVTV